MSYLGRPFRGGRRYFSYSRDSEKTEWNERQDAVSQKHPSELRGKEIGLWYAQRGRMKKKREEKQQRPVIEINVKEERKFRGLLNDMKTLRPSMSRTSGATATASSSDEWGRDAFQFGCTSGETEQKTQSSSADVPHVDISEDDTVPSVSEVLEFMKEEADFIEIAFRKLQSDEEFDAPPIGKQRNQNPLMDEHLFQQQEAKRDSRHYQNMLAHRQNLPSYKMKDKLLQLINENQVVVISGETGCGKTTQIPQFILDDFIEKKSGSLCSVVCTQPRRISAVSVAQRVADERDEMCGKNGSVGYQIRLESKLPRPYGSLLYCTTGILLKWLESDPLLSRATHIILDEIHERDLLSDFLMIILKDIMLKRPDLKLILMSATLNAEIFSEYFGGCPIANIPGFTYFVEEYFLEDVIEMLDYDPPPQPPPPSRKRAAFFKNRRWEMNKEVSNNLELEEWLQVLNCSKKYSVHTLNTLRNMDFKILDVDLVTTLVKYICVNKEEGAILVFVPGWSDIKKINERIVDDPLIGSSMFQIIPLHSLMPTVNQRNVFERPPPGIRKIILATNIAESSITIDDVVYVIDTGQIKVKNFEADKNLTTLEPQSVSKASAKQRRGRAGRVQPGECYHLFTRLQASKLLDHLPPEMLRTRLEELCLQIKLLKLGRIEPFVCKAIQPPSIEALHIAIETLQNLNALDQEENLLPLGYHLARMPVDPHSGKMILFGAMFSCLDPILTIAASLSFKDAFIIPLGKEAEADRARKRLADGTKSDHILLIKAFQGWENAKRRGSHQQYCWDNFLFPNTLALLKDMKSKFASLIHDLGFLSDKNPQNLLANRNSDNESLVKAIICAGLYPNVAKITKVSKWKVPSLQTKTDKRVALHPKSVNSTETSFESNWMIYHQKLKTTGIFLHDSTMVSPYPLLFFGGKINTMKDEDQDCITVDDWIVFQASPNTAQLVMDLREELDHILKNKIRAPGMTKWNEKEGFLMKAIINLITKEDN